MSPEELARRIARQIVAAADDAMSPTPTSDETAADAALPFATALLAAEEALGKWESARDHMNGCPVCFYMESDECCEDYHRLMADGANLRDDALALLREALR